jgi:hypothetical protein
VLIGAVALQVSTSRERLDAVVLDSKPALLKFVSIRTALAKQQPMAVAAAQVVAFMPAR